LPSSWANAQNSQVKQFLAGIILGMVAASGWSDDVLPYSPELVQKAESGDALAQYNLGRAYLHGKGVTGDYKEAVKWFIKSAEQGNSFGQNAQGVCYRDGLGVSKDEKEAVKWFIKSAEQGNMKAQYNLGRCYQTGGGVPRNEKEAVKLYTKAAEQEYAAAQYKLGGCYYKGVGVGKDEKEALKWYTKVSSLQLQKKGSLDNRYIGLGSMETGNFAKSKEALLLAGNNYGPTAVNIKPESMRLTGASLPAYDSVLQILDPEGNEIGTGVFCDAEGWVLTAAHVVAGQEQINVRDKNMNLWNVEAICPGDFSNDIALLKTTSRNCLFVEVADDDLNLSDKVVQIGHPYGVMNQIISEGVISSLKGDGNTWNCSFASMPGNSGSPVFNEEWELVGITSRATYFSDSKTDSDLSRTWVVPLGYLKKILQDGKNNKNFHPIALSKEWESRCKFWSSTESKQARKLLAVNTLLSDSFEEPNPQKAAAIIVTEAERGSPEAINLLGQISYKGEGVPKDPEKAFQLWRESAEMGNTQAMNRLGTELGREGVASKNRGEALKWFQKAAEQGDADGMATTGAYYFNGWGVERDFQQAEKWIQASAEKGSAFGQYVYGLMFECGYGVRLNPGKSAYWYEQSAKGGYIEGMVKYGQCLEYGSGVRENQAEAIVWYKKAADKKSASALFFLGSAYANGRGVPKDFSRAVDLWKQSSKMGNQDAIRRLITIGVEVIE